MSADVLSMHGYVVSHSYVNLVAADPVAVLPVVLVGLGGLVLFVLVLAWSIHVLLRDLGQGALSSDLSELKRTARETEAEFEKGRRELAR